MVTTDGDPLTDLRNGSASDSSPEGYVFESRIGQASPSHTRHISVRDRLAQRQRVRSPVLKVTCSNHVSVIHERVSTVRSPRSSTSVAANAIKNFNLKRNPRKVRWTKARKVAGKEMAVDPTFELEKRRNRPVKYDRDLVGGDAARHGAGPGGPIQKSGGAPQEPHGQAPRDPRARAREDRRAPSSRRAAAPSRPGTGVSRSPPFCHGTRRACLAQRRSALLARLACRRDLLRRRGSSPGPPEPAGFYVDSVCASIGTPPRRVLASRHRCETLLIHIIEVGAARRRAGTYINTVQQGSRSLNALLAPLRDAPIITAQSLR